MLVNVSYRDSHRLDNGDRSSASSRPARPAPATRPGSASAPRTGRGSSTPRSFADVQVHALREPDAGPARQRLERRRSTRRRHAPRHRTTSTARAVHGAQAGRQRRGQRVHPAGHRSVRLHRRTACRPAAAWSGSARRSTRTTSSATPARSAYNLTLSGKGLRHNHPRRLSAVHRLGGSDPQLERLGLDHGSRRRHLLQRHADLLPGDVPGAGDRRSCRRSTPSTDRRASR